MQCIGQHGQSIAEYSFAHRTDRLYRMAQRNTNWMADLTLGISGQIRDMTTGPAVTPYGQVTLMGVRPATCETR